MMRNRIATILLLLLCSVMMCAQSQQDKIQELLQRIDDYPERDTGYTNLLFEAAVYYLNVDRDESREYAEEMRFISSDLGHKDGIAAATNILGACYWYDGDNDKALEEFGTAMELYEELNNDEKVILLTNNMGLVHGKDHEYYKAYTMHKKAYEDARDKGYHYLEMLALHNKSYDLYGNRNYKSAYEEGAKLIALMEEYKDIDHQRLGGLKANGIASQISTGIHLMDVEDVLPYVRMAEDAIKEGELAAYESSILRLSLGEWKQANGEHTGAIQEYNQVLRTISLDQFGSKHMEAHLGLLRAYLSLRNTRDAIQHGEKAISLIDNNADPQERMDIYDHLSQAYWEAGDHDRAIEYGLVHRAYNDSLNVLINDNRITEADYLANVNSTLLENQKLTLQAEASSNALRNRNVSVLTLLSLLGLLSAITWYIVKRNKRRATEVVHLEKKVKQSTQHLVDKNADLKEKNNELERFAYIASHDLKEPLRNIHGFVKLIEMKAGDDFDEKLSSYFGYVKSNAAQMQRLINDVLNYTKLSQQEIEIVPMDLNKLVGAIASQTDRPNAIVVGDDLPTINGPVQIIKMVLERLIENGLKFNDSDSPEVKVSYADGDQYHIINVVDNGIGIPVSYHDKVFDMFERLHSRERYEGSGIGLAMCQKAMDRIGGMISVRSVDGKGARFTISFPKQMKLESALRATG